MSPRDAFWAILVIIVLLVAALIAHKDGLF